MTWYAAHIITYIRFLDGIQVKFPIWENIVIIESPTGDEAFKQAEDIGANSFSHQGSSFVYEGHPAEWVFVGVRKIIECRLDFDAEVRSLNEQLQGLPHGTEVTYSIFEADSLDVVNRFAEGDSIEIRYEE